MQLTYVLMHDTKGWNQPIDNGKYDVTIENLWRHIYYQLKYREPGQINMQTSLTWGGGEEARLQETDTAYPLTKANY